MRIEQLSDDVILYNADCRDVLPTLGKVDAVVTDPPYGLGKRMQGGTWGAQDHNSGFLKWDLDAPDWFPQLIEGMPSIVWGGNYLPFPPTRCWLVWNKVNAVPTMADFEQAWTNLDRPSKRMDLPVGRVEFGHPTQKPLPLMAWCLGFLPNARTILDPFMGSGTTGVACVQLGRKFKSARVCHLTSQSPRLNRLTCFSRHPLQNLPTRIGRAVTNNYGVPDAF